MIPSRFDELLKALAAPSASHAGGVAGAAAGALAASLVEMVAGMTVLRPRYASVHNEMERVRDGAAALRERLVGLMAEDVEALRRKSGTADTQRELAGCASAVAALARSAAERGHAPARGDALMAALLAAAVARGAAANVEINTAAATDQEALDLRRAAWADAAAADQDVAALPHEGPAG